MNTNISILNTRRRLRAAESNTVDFRSPKYDCSEQDGALTLLVYVPGVDSTGVEITASGPALIVTARKKHFIRVNFDALNLENAQKDYRLTLRLGNNLDYENLNADISNGVLTITLPKRGSSGTFNRLRKVA
ncbi:MAG: Hsp20/alpha crystallin family protein [Opitutaceae bacterium]|jgi:HSP20 family molecular chaperone IbpA